MLNIKAVIITIVVLAVGFFAIPHKIETPTKESCVAYWTTRVSTWDNPPSIDTIENDVYYCGGLL